MSGAVDNNGGRIVFESSSDSDQLSPPSQYGLARSPLPPNKKARVSEGSLSHEKNKKADADGSTDSGSTISARHNQVFSIKPMSEAIRNAKKDEAMPGAVDLRDSKEARPTTGHVTFDAAALTKKHAPQSPEPSTDEDDEPAEIVTKYVKLEEPVDDANMGFPQLSGHDVRELEKALQLNIDNEEEGWRTDWGGNLDLAFERIPNPESPISWGDLHKSLIDWAPTSAFNHLMLNKFLAHIHNMQETPPSAKRLIRAAYLANRKIPRGNVKELIQRISYDPDVLREDGWITQKSAKPEGASGGPHRIGSKIIWDNYEAIVIAFVRDPDMGDLWKALYPEDGESFDIEADELDRGLRRWKRKHGTGNAPRERRESSRYVDTSKFTVEGIEHGIVLAQTNARNARHGVLWPARIEHVSEIRELGKRSSAKHKIHVMFLAPYWNADDRGQAWSHEAQGENIFSEELVEISEETIQPYPENYEQGLHIDRLRNTFRFTGLPKSTFPRFLDSHRLAMGLKMYAKKELKTHSYTASAPLFDTHPLSILTAEFPPSVLHLPFGYILSNLRAPGTEQQGRAAVEPAVDIACILKGMEPPSCWGQTPGDQPLPMDGASNKFGAKRKDEALFSDPFSISSKHKVVKRAPASRHVTVDNITSVYLKHELHRLKSCFPITQLSSKLEGLVSQLWNEDVADVAPSPVEWTKISTFLRDCLLVKGHGEDIIGSLPDGTQIDRSALTQEWRETCERLYREASCQFSWAGFGNGATVVISDSRCNEHITSSGAYERPVRLPAALKASRLAKAELSDGALHILPRVKDSYMEAAKRIIPKTHSIPYIERIKLRCSSLPPEAIGEPLTENSEGDTTGARGSFTAALAGVAAAVKGVDMIVGGQCVNVFCATRPPGHHAGRSMHPMKATSNGFCILNPAACAALYAATPVSEGGMGLRRVCVIDFDVHHGNGTQDVLCSTEDPRFLYVSLHAGGPQYNGYETEDDSEVGYRSSVGSTARGIFPGRCGDTSPHRGVLNIPLGGRFTAVAVGNALVSKVAPAVEDFSPDLIVLSAGFDGHAYDPLRLGALSAEDYGHITNVACDMAHKLCGGRVISILEGGYGVPCCRPQEGLFLPPSSLTHLDSSSQLPHSSYSGQSTSQPIQTARPQPNQFADLGPDLPDDMDDQVTYELQKSLDKCHDEGFVDCVKAHVRSLGSNNRRISATQAATDAALENGSRVR